MTASGAIRDIEVEPANAVTACLSKQFGKTMLPAPPAGILRNKNFPLLVEVKMTSRAKALARSTGTAIPVFSQIIAYTYPDNFVPAFENSFGGSYLQESVLQGESAERWSQMITLTGARDEAKDPGLHAEGLRGQDRHTLQPGLSGHFFEPGGGHNAGGGPGCLRCRAGLWHGPFRHAPQRSHVDCRDQGKSDMYTVQWAERSAPVQQPPVLDGVKWGQRFSY